MTEEELAELMARAGPGYRASVEPPTERIWAAVEARVFQAPAIQPRGRPNWPWFIAIAAALLVGVGLGLSAAGYRQPGRTLGPSDGPGSVSNASLGPSPFVGQARDYLQQTIGLVVALASDLRTGQVLPSTTNQARDLLSTTRLLLDNQPADPGLRSLLEDLELVLAQVVQLPDARQPFDDAKLIADAMDQRGVLPRLAVLVSDHSTAP